MSTSDRIRDKFYVISMEFLSLSRRLDVSSRETSPAAIYYAYMVIIPLCIVEP